LDPYASAFNSAQTDLGFLEMNKTPLAVLCIILFLIAMSAAAGCISLPEQEPALTVIGATDVVRIAEAVKDGFQQASGIDIQALPSKDALKDMKSGKADLILIGRELSAAELEGLQDETVAYDAVCLLVSLRTFEGGTESGFNDRLYYTKSKFDGIKNLQLSDLKGHYGNLLKILSGENYWHLSLGFYTFKPYYPDSTFYSMLEDPKRPGYALGMMSWVYAPLGGELTPPGLTDSQFSLLQKLGYDKEVLNTPDLGFISSGNVGSEEEWISARYKLMPEDPNQIASQPFDNFYLMPVSRQVAVRALQHEFAIRVLSVDGVDPLSDPQVIYDGTYPLSRKIHVLAKRPYSADVEKMIQYLLSAQGQMQIEQASFLPLPK
jgi:hypothetical protein